MQKLIQRIKKRDFFHFLQITRVGKPFTPLLLPVCQSSGILNLGVFYMDSGSNTNENEINLGQE